MNQLQEKQISNAKSSIEATKRALSELERFGWQPSRAVEPLEYFPKYVAMLDKTEKAIQALKPRADQSHEKELTALLEKESYYVETLDALARTAATSLTAEEIAFFEARDQFMQPVKSAITAADEQITMALAVLAEALQVRWTAVGNQHKIMTLMHAISSIHKLEGAYPEPGIIQWQKPFAKMGHFSFPPFVKVFLERVHEVFAGAENWQPVDAAERVFEK